MKKLLDAILLGNVSKIVLTHRDRLLRFGSELIFHICQRLGVEVELIEEEVGGSDEENLAKDVIEWMVVFCARLHGRRAHRKKGKRKS